MTRKLGFWPLVALIFFTVSGGAYGLEALVGAVGAKWALILVLALPFLWVLPISLMVSELSAAIPEKGGFYVWVRRGLGPFWGFQEGWWTLCYSVVDVALYPVLFVTYLSYFFPALSGSDFQCQLMRWGVCFVFVSAALVFNLRGSRWVGMSALANLVVVSFPFVLLTIWGVSHGNWGLLVSAMKAPIATNIQPASIAAGLAIILWNYSGWDNISTYADEVENPARNYPRALALAILIIVLSYILPLLAGFKVTITPADWGNSSGWPAIAEKLGGAWLGTFGAATALLSAWAMFNSQLLYVSRLTVAMAQDGWLPRGLAQTSNSLVAIAACAAVFSSLSLSKLIVLDILFYTLGLSLEFFALIALRSKEPGLARPFRIPLNRMGLVCMSLLPLSIACIVAVTSVLGTSGSLLQIGLVGFGITAGAFVYGIRIGTIREKADSIGL